MAFLNAVGELAEAEGHHPDFHLTGYRNVRIELSTHAIGGLSMPDMVRACSAGLQYRIRATSCIAAMCIC